MNSSVAPYSGSWTSAQLNSSNLQSFPYGRIESSMALPTAAGLWPAFWALGANIARWLARIEAPEVEVRALREQLAAAGGEDTAQVPRLLEGTPSVVPVPVPVPAPVVRESRPWWRFWG